jgi:hypothetical protein
VPLFWLNYCDHNGQAAGVVVMEAEALIAARMKAAVSGLDPGFECTGYQLDDASARQIPAGMIGGLLDDTDLHRLQEAITPKKAAAPSVWRRAAAAKRSVAKR